MPAATVPKTAPAIGAGYLYEAAIGSSLPANTVAGSVFTDAWPGAWNLWGITVSGSEFDNNVTTAEILAAEYFDPIQVVTTERSSSLKFELMQVTATNFFRSINGGSLTVSGSGATQLNHLTPPAVGAEVRIMVGWESQDNTERLILEQCFQIGSLAIKRDKGANVATLPVEFHAEVAASGQPWQYWSAGTTRA